jgi:hypothetical protein
LSAGSHCGLIVSHGEQRRAGKPYAQLAVRRRDDRPKASPERAKRRADERGLKPEACRQAEALAGACARVGEAEAC